eukprot:TRINITY_DN62816_c0_g1_i1.p1 TRINITY_DN62816_c0_g1~~TRINITY_DN62816_c0_g1_i1.p1  ORF type:complete len:365 (-),score=93.61 TRINITY_DN62816_c0_g1_i1:108-1136(-)
MSRESQEGMALKDGREPTVHDQVKFIDGQLKQRSASMLFFGALMGFLGFCFVAYLGFYSIIHNSKQNAMRHQLTGQQYPSGNDYMPQSVSEMVHNPASAVGKIFFGFMMIGAICMLVSWYPQELTNVYVGDDTKCLRWCGPSIVVMRNFLPPVGMMLVACITAVPAPQANYTDIVSTNIHTFGAIIMIAGYAGFEIHALWPGQKVIKIKPAERVARWTTIIICLLGALVFQYCGAIIENPGKADSCWDKWAVPDMNSINAKSLPPGVSVWDRERDSENVMRLVDTAKDWCLTVKQANYIGECFAGVFMIANMLVIWYFCPERKINLNEDAMLSVTDEESGSE